MAFEQLHDRIGPIAPIAPFVPPAERAVPDVAGMVREASAALNKTIEEFSPLTKAEREAKLNTYLTASIAQRKAYEAAQRNDWDTYNKIMNNHLVPARMSLEEYRQRKEIDYKASHPNNPSPFAGLFRAAQGAGNPSASPVIDNIKSAQPTGPKDNMVTRGAPPYVPRVDIYNDSAGSSTERKNYLTDTEQI